MSVQKVRQHWLPHSVFSSVFPGSQGTLLVGLVADVILVFRNPADSVNSLFGLRMDVSSPSGM